LPEKYVLKISKMPEFYMIPVRKIIKMPEFYMIFARKIYRIAKFYMIFARKIPEFYIIIARKIFFPNFRGYVPPCPPSPTPMDMTASFLCQSPAVNKQTK